LAEKFILENDFAPVPTQALLDDLKRVASEGNGTAVTFRHYNQFGRYNSSTVSERFGSWNAALEKAGLIPTKVRNYGDEDLFSNMITVWERYGRQPRFREMSAPPSIISVWPYQRRFGSWINALKAFVEFANAEDMIPPVAEIPNAKSKPPRNPSMRLRFYVLSRDSFRCVTCGASPATQVGLFLHIDHIVPWSKGGQTVRDNLQTLCDRCNLGKSNVL
jgi:hypothetical protein